MSVPCLIERLFRGIFDRVGAAIPRQHSVEGKVKIVDQMYVIDHCDDDTAQ